MRSTATTVVVAGAALALLLTACAPGTGTTEPDAPEPQEISTDVAALGDVTLTVWDQEVRGGQDAQMAALNEAFMAEYPNVTIDRNSQSFDDLETTLRGALTGDEAPDVVQANNTRGTMGAFVEAGLLMDLDGYADAYGWRDRYSESVLAVSSYGDGGATFGEGALYGLPQTGEIVGIFYSRSALEAAGVDEQALTSIATWDEFTNALDTVLESGATPIELGNLDGWPAGHVFGPIQGQYVPPEEIAMLGMGNAGASWTTPENEAAATELQRWVDAGYFNEGPNGTDYDAAWASFSEGSAAFLIGGSWLAADLEAAMGDDVGFMAPPAPAGGDVATTGGTGLPFAITAQSPDQTAAAAYLDFITSDEAMEVLAENGNMPVNRTAELAPTEGVNAQIFEAFGAVSEGGHLLPYLDWATPTMGDTLGAGLQDLIGGQSTPTELLETLEADYGAFTQGG